MMLGLAPKAAERIKKLIQMKHLQQCLAQSK